LFETPLGERASAIVAYRRSLQGPLYNKILDLFDNSTAARRDPLSRRGASVAGALAPRSTANHRPTSSTSTPSCC
jgi:hypothetical protein